MQFVWHVKRICLEFIWCLKGFIFKQNNIFDEFRSRFISHWHFYHEFSIPKTENNYILNCTQSEKRDLIQLDISDSRSMHKLEIVAEKLNFDILIVCNNYSAIISIWWFVTEIDMVCLIYVCMSYVVLGFRNFIKSNIISKLICGFSAFYFCFVWFHLIVCTFLLFFRMYKIQLYICYMNEMLRMALINKWKQVKKLTTAMTATQSRCASNDYTLYIQA